MKNMKKIFTYSPILFFALVLLSINCHAQNVIFSEDFADSLSADWVTEQKDGQPVTATSNWKHTFIGPEGGAATDPIASTTSSNGWMIFDSDLDCTQNPQDVWLISPAFDCTMYDTVVVKFNSFYLSFNDIISIQVSTDSLENWKEYLVHPGITAGEFGGQPDGSENPTQIVINVTDTAAFKSNVRIAFRFHSELGLTDNGGDVFFGCAYNWQVDDLEVVDVDPTPRYDIRTNRNFYALAPSTVTPVSQVESFGFLCDIENIGLNDITNANINISIKDSDEMLLHSDDLLFDTIPSGTLVENEIFNDVWTPPNLQDIYTGSYKATIAENDENSENDEISFVYVVSDSVFAKELGQIDDGFSPTNAKQTGVWTAANHYYVPNGSGFICSSVLVGIANAQAVAGSTINVFLYEWENINGDLTINSIERNGIAGGRIVGNTSYTIQPEDKDVIVVLEDWDGSPENLIRLKDNTHYVLAVETSTATPGVPVQIINGRQDYGAMIFVHQDMELPRFGSFSNRNSIGQNIPYFIENFSAKIRMHIQEDVTSIDNQLSQEHLTQIYPIPTNDILNVKLDFKSTMDKVKIRLTDISGRTLFSDQLIQLKTSDLKIKLTDFPQGTYFLCIETEEGSRTRKFTINR